MSISAVDKDYQKRKKKIVGYLEKEGIKKEKNAAGKEKPLRDDQVRAITQQHLWTHLNALAVCQFMVQIQDDLQDCPFFNGKLKFHSKQLLQELLKTPSEAIAQLSNYKPEALWELVTAMETLSKLLFTLMPEDLATLICMGELFQENPLHAEFFRKYIHKLPKSEQATIPRHLHILEGQTGIL